MISNERCHLLQSEQMQHAPQPEAKIDQGGQRRQHQPASRISPKQLSFVAIPYIVLQIAENPLIRSCDRIHHEQCS